MTHQPTAPTTPDCASCSLQPTAPTTPDFASRMQDLRKGNTNDDHTSELSCPICFERYDHDKHIPIVSRFCQHSICSICLHKMGAHKTNGRNPLFRSIASRTAAFTSPSEHIKHDCLLCRQSSGFSQHQRPSPIVVKLLKRNKNMLAARDRRIQRGSALMAGPSVFDFRSRILETIYKAEDDDEELELFKDVLRSKVAENVALHGQLSELDTKLKEWKLAHQSLLDEKEIDLTMLQVKLNASKQVGYKKGRECNATTSPLEKALVGFLLMYFLVLMTWGVTNGHSVFGKME